MVGKSFRTGRSVYAESQAGEISRHNGNWELFDDNHVVITCHDFLDQQLSFMASGSFSFPKDHSQLPDGRKMPFNCMLVENYRLPTAKQMMGIQCMYFAV